MEKRRCFSIDVIESLPFRRLSPEAKAIYFALMAHADDEGVVVNHSIALCLQNIEEQAMKELVDNEFLLMVNDMYIVKHWFMHNRVQPSKFTESLYKAELSKLYVNDRKEYAFL